MFGLRSLRKDARVPSSCGAPGELFELTAPTLLSMTRQVLQMGTRETRPSWTRTAMRHDIEQPQGTFWNRSLQTTSDVISTKYPANARDGGRSSDKLNH